MKRKIRKLPVGLAAAALVLTAALSIGGAMAYFTTYSTASGGATLNMGFTTTVPGEEVDNGGKHVVITNTGDYDCYVRVKAFSTVELTYSSPDGTWTDGGDGYWYYTEVLKAGESTGVLPKDAAGDTEASGYLDVSYTLPAQEKDADGNAIARPDVDVIVVQECTPVLYDEDGEPYADWNYTVTTDTSTDSSID